MTSELWKGLLVGVVAMGLVSCKGEDTSSEPQANAHTEEDPGHTHAEGDGDHGHDHDEPAMTQDTPEGAVALFMDAMKNGDFEGAAAVSDPTSFGYDALAQLVEGFKKIEGNPNQAEVQNLVLPFLVQPWKDAKSKAVSIRDERAKFDMSFANGKSIEVDVVKNDGLWVMFLPEGILDIGTKKKDTGVPDGQASS